MPSSAEPTGSRPGRLQQARRLFEELVEFDAAEQRRALDALTDPGLAELVERLLVHDADTYSLSTPGRTAVADLLDEPFLGEQIGAFQVQGRLGRGGMGVVYEATQQRPNRTVALKTIRPDLVSPQALGRFRREVELMARVSHPGIPAVYEYFESGAQPVLVMERVVGQRADVAAEGWPLTRRVELLVTICDAVAAAHEAGVVHRDLKPSNILVTDAGQPKVLDFGIASLGGRRASAPEGTPRYMAPEQIRGGAVDVRTDVFALGVLGFKICTGELPADVPTGTPGHEVRLEPLDPPPALPRPLAAIFARAQSRASADRYADARSLQADLRAYLEHRPVEALGRTPWRCLLMFLKRRRRVLVGAAAVAFAAAGLVAGGLAVQDWQQRRATLAQGQRLFDAVRGQAAADDPAFEAPFVRLVDDPTLADTRIPARAWLWRSVRQGTAQRRASAARALAAAVHPGEERAALESLAIASHELLEFDAVGGVLRELPADALPELRRLHRFALGGPGLSQGLSPAEQAALLPPLRALAETAPAPQEGLLAQTAGGLMLAAVGEGRVTVRDADGATLLQADLPCRPAAREAVAEGEAFLHVCRRGAEGGTELTRLDPASGRVARLPTLAGQWRESGVHAGPDGIERRYVWTSHPGGLWVGPVGGALRTVDAPFTPPGLRPGHGAAFGDLDGDGHVDLITATGLWHGHGLRVFLGPDFELAGVLDLAARKVAILHHPRRGTELLAVGAPVGSRAQAIPGEAAAPVQAVRAAWVDGRLEVRQTLRLSGAEHEILPIDLDGDGVDEVLLHGRGMALGAWVDDDLVFTRFASTARPIAAVELDGDAGAELLVGSTEQASLQRLVLGSAGGAPMVLIPPTSSTVPPVPEGAAPRSRRAWATAERLVGAGLVGDGITVFESIVAWGGPAADAAGFAAIDLAGRIPVSGWVGRVRRDRAAQLRVARQLLLRSPARLSDADRATLLAIAGATAAPDLLARLGEAPAGWDEPEVVVPGRTAALTFDRPESMRLGPNGALRLVDARADGEPVASLRLEPRGPVVAVELDFEALEHDFGASLGIRLRSGEATVDAYVGRGGGGRLEHHNRGFWCHGQPTERDRYEAAGRLRVVWDRAAGRVVCSLDEARVVQVEGPVADGPLRLELITAASPGYAPVLVDLRIDQLLLRGARSVADPAWPALALALAGDVERLQRLAEGTGITAAWAAAELGRAGEADLTSLTDAELMHLLRTRPATWKELVRAHAGRDFDRLWARAWDVSIHFDTERGRRELGHPALAGLATDTEDLRGVVRARARALVGEGRLAEARYELRRLAEADDGRARVDLAALEQAQGRPDRARRWLNRAVAAPHPTATREHLRKRPELAAHADALAWPFAVAAVPPLEPLR